MTAGLGGNGSASLADFSNCSDLIQVAAQALFGPPHNLAQGGLRHAEPSSCLGEAAFLRDDDEGGKIGDFIASHLSLS